MVACLSEQVKDSRSLRSDFERENIPILNLSADRRYASLFLRSLERLLSAKNPDIVRTHLPHADYTGCVARIFDRDLVGVCSVRVISGKLAGEWSLSIFDSVCRLGDPPCKIIG